MNNFKRFIQSICLSLCLIFFFSSCVSEVNNLKVKLSPVNKSIVELTSKKYDISELSNIENDEGTIDELNERYPIECLRRINNTYRVSYFGDKIVTTIIFDDSGKKIASQTHKVSQTVYDFDSVSIGTSVEEIIDKFPEGEYSFLYAGRNDFPRESYHYTSDGYLITILYDEDNKIISINRELI